MIPQPRITSFRLSPNQTARNLIKGDRHKAPIEYIILHNTTENMQSTINTFLNSMSMVSAHLVLSRNCESHQFVPFEKTAWHAGNRDLNLRSIGIEVEAYEGAKGFAPGQAELLVAWIRYFQDIYHVSSSKILMHRQIRKTLCPSFLWPTDEEFAEFKQKHKI